MLSNDMISSKLIIKTVLRTIVGYLIVYFIILSGKLDEDGNLLIRTVWVILAFIIGNLLAYILNKIVRKNLF